MSILLFILLVILLIGLLPTWPYSSGWGYYPSGGVGLVDHSLAFGSALSAILIRVKWRSRPIDRTVYRR